MTAITTKDLTVALAAVTGFDRQTAMKGAANRVNTAIAYTYFKVTEGMSKQKFCDKLGGLHAGNFGKMIKELDISEESVKVAASQLGTAEIKTAPVTTNPLVVGTTTTTVSTEKDTKMFDLTSITTYLSSVSNKVPEWDATQVAAANGLKKTVVQSRKNLATGKVEEASLYNIIKWTVYATVNGDKKDAIMAARFNLLDTSGADKIQTLINEYGHLFASYYKKLGGKSKAPVATDSLIVNPFSSKIANVIEKPAPVAAPATDVASILAAAAAAQAEADKPKHTPAQVIALANIAELEAAMAGKGEAFCQVISQHIAAIKAANNL